MADAVDREFDVPPLCIEQEVKLVKYKFIHPKHRFRHPKYSDISSYTQSISSDIQSTAV